MFFLMCFFGGNSQNHFQFVKLKKQKHALSFMPYLYLYYLLSLFLSIKLQSSIPNCLIVFLFACSARVQKPYGT